MMSEAGDLTRIMCIYPNMYTKMMMMVIISTYYIYIYAYVDNSIWLAHSKVAEIRIGDFPYLGCPRSTYAVESVSSVKCTSTRQGNPERLPLDIPDWVVKELALSRYCKETIFCTIVLMVIWFKFLNKNPAEVPTSSNLCTSLGSPSALHRAKHEVRFRRGSVAWV